MSHEPEATSYLITTDRSLALNDKQTGLVWLIDKYAPRIARGPARRVTFDGDALSEFADLHNQSPIEVRDFARRWGPLWLCSHDLPMTHRDLFDLDGTLMKGRRCQVRSRPHGAGTRMAQEPLRFWAQLSMHVDAMRHLAVGLREKDLGQPDDWRLFYGLKSHPGIRVVAPSRLDESPLPFHLLINTGDKVRDGLRDLHTGAQARAKQLKADSLFTPATSAAERGVLEKRVATVRQAGRDALHSARLDLSGRLTHWMQAGGVRPVASWRADQESPAFDIRVDGLFGAVALQLAVSIAGTKGKLRDCRGCRQPFVPERAQERYCRACREAGVPHRDAVRRNRAKRPTKGRVVI